MDISPLVGEIVRSVADFIRERTGALFVIVGRDPVDRHLEGGYDLDGIPTTSLFKSIFDPHSVGHDGAVVIENERIKCFAAHLPLSKNLQKIADYGTRHTAALGLSERCDALCIVVSEERGRVSIARDGNLREVGDLERLGPIVTRFMKEKFPQGKESIWKRVFGKNWKEKMIALALGIVLWLLFAQPSEVFVKDFEVPIEYINLPHDYVLDKVEPKKLQVTLSGDVRAFDIFNTDSLKAVLDLSKIKIGKQNVKIRENMFELPRQIKLRSVDPNEVDIKASLKPPIEPEKEKETAK